MGKSLLCLVLTGPTLEENLKAIDSYRTHIDLVELRADYLDPDELSSLARFPGLAGLPVILTLRRMQDGGKFQGEENSRRRLIAAALGPPALASEDPGAKPLGTTTPGPEAPPGGYAYVDLEQDVSLGDLEDRIRQSGSRIIRSLHDFSGVSQDLELRLRRLSRHPADVPKAALLPHNSRELLYLVRTFMGFQAKEKILIAMGELGRPTRVLAAKLGSLLSYCAVPGRESAAGQLDPLQISEHYGFRSLGEETRVFGLLGNPVAHSRSPEIHNRGYRALGIDAVYLPFRVDELDSFFALAYLLDIQGLSVTVPFKEQVIPYLRRQNKFQGSVSGVGACNTLIRRNSGWFGTNTDVEGFMAPLKQRGLSRGAAGLAHLKGTVLGAGGAARAVVYALNRAGMKPLVLNRSPERAKLLAEAYGCPHGGLNQQGASLMAEYAGLIVQTTSLGMAPAVEEDPLPQYHFRGTETVYELVYNPPLTHFLKRAQQAGCTVIQGLEMLQAQAEAQFRLFTGKDYPAELGVE